ncbi:MAG: HDOD domain-containing protein [Spartobacteria bacterium]|nr:HDOD domain-containing protein [Spartobacteria bacterium]
MPKEFPVILKELENIRNLPTLPVVLERVKKAVRDPKSNADQIARIVMDDPAMMARILKVVNSPLYAGAEKIDSLQMAISRLGFTALHNVALSTSVFTSFAKTANSVFDRIEFWRHCISTGIAANAVCTTCRSKLKRRYSPDMLHLAGLLHDIGKIILDNYYNDEFTRAIGLTKEQGVPLCAAETQCVGATHNQVGGWLAQKWNLAPELVEVVRWHHAPHNASDEAQELVEITHVANYICNFRMIGDGGDTISPSCQPGVLKRLGLEEETYWNILDSIVEESKKSEILLSLL